MPAMEKIHCMKCGRDLAENQYYTLRDGSHPNLCKKCMTLHLDAFRPETFTWIMEILDVPYIPAEWNVLRDKLYAADPKKVNGSILGKYLSKMRLNQWRQYHWADTERLQEEAKINKAKAENAVKNFEEMITEQYKKGEISEAQFKTLTSSEVQRDETPPMIAPEAPQQMESNFYNEVNYLKEEELVDLGAELTDEDKMYLAMKWGRLYKPSEWVELEKNYNSMINSFDIHDADSINTLVLICKTNLKANQALDSGDVDGFQKLSRVLDSLRKSAKFTAAQNKEQKNDYVDSCGELVAMCEKNGFIPRFATDIPQDKVDATLQDMNKYTYKLVTQDLGFGQQIEDALKKIQIQKEMEEAEEELDNIEDVIELEDMDYEDYFDSIDIDKDLDMKIMMGEV